MPLSTTQGLFMYWITSSLFSMAQVTTLRSDRVRKLLGIPPRLDATKMPAITGRAKDEKKSLFKQAKDG